MPNVETIDAGRDGSRLELDHQFYCKECGIELPWQVVLIGEFDRCRKCEREALLKQFNRDFPVSWRSL